MTRSITTRWQILATKDDGAVLAVAKASPSELQADQDVARYTEITERQPGWRLDVFVLGPDVPTVPTKGEVREPSDEDLARKALPPARSG
jgi:hypothetical protein